MLLDKQIKSEIMSKLSEVNGYEVKEDSLDYIIILKIRKIVTIKKVIFILNEMFRAEKGRTKNHMLLRIGNNLSVDDSLLEVQFEQIKSQVNNKINEMADDILKARLNTNAVNEVKFEDIISNKNVEVNCPGCNSSLFLETISTLPCGNCGTKLHTDEIIPLIEIAIKKI